MGFPLLSTMFLVLAAGAALVWLRPGREWARGTALAAVLGTLTFSLIAVARFDAANPGFQFVERAEWIPGLGIRYAVGVDGLSLLFLPTTALVFLGTIAASWNAVREMPRLYYSLLLLLAGATLGVFCALDTILFYLCWELTLAPVYFLASLWGVGPQRRHAAVKYTLVMLAGGVPLLFGFIVLAFAHPGDAMMFDLATLLAQPVAREAQFAVFLLLLAGFAVKVPLVPLHTWLPVMAMEGPVAVTALLAGLKLGAYGLIRFAVPLAPQAAQELHWLLAGLGTAGILYGAAAALAQSNLRRMLAYSGISHVGLVVLGIASFRLQGVQGAVLQLVNFTLAAGGAFLLAAFLHQRTGSNDAGSLGGAARSMPLLASFFLIFGLAGMGLPGTSGFPAELLILISAFKTHAGAGLAALAGMVLGAAYFLGLYRRVFLGPPTPAVAGAQDLRPRELAVAFAFALLLIVFGLLPAPLLELMRPAAEAWVAALR